MTVYVDTCCLVAYYAPEALTEKVARELSGHRWPTISRLVEVEFHSAIARKLRKGEMDHDDASSVASKFEAHLSEGRYRVAPVEAREYDLARDWIGRFTVPLTALDALHLAATFANDLELMTADRQLSRAAQHFGVECVLIA